MTHVTTLRLVTRRVLQRYQSGTQVIDDSHDIREEKCGTVFIRFIRIRLMQRVIRHIQGDVVAHEFEKVLGCQRVIVYPRNPVYSFYFFSLQSAQ